MRDGAYRRALNALAERRDKIGTVAGGSRSNAGKANTLAEGGCDNQRKHNGAQKLRTVNESIRMANRRLTPPNEIMMKSSL
jgi:hypothetical protein